MKTEPRNQPCKANPGFKNLFRNIFYKALRSCSSKRSFIILLNVLLSSSVYAQSLPSGFAKVQVASGLTNPTAMAFAPDGRIFVTQQNGVVRVIKNGSLLATPFLQLSVHATGERGLIGITLDPAFSTNQFVYLYYTLPDGSRNRISRFTSNGDVAVAGSESLVLNLDPLSSATNHNGGAMHFGPDGKLYVAVGDNANSNHAQNLDTYHGKFLRMNKDGSIPAGNPFSGSAQRSRVWAYGLRNPFTFDIQPGTGRILVNDVGQSTWEEINDATAGGKNFGWPMAEGNSSNPAFSNPVYSYAHGAGDGVGCSIAGGVFLNPASTNYPAAYWGDYFFLDYCNQWINFLDLSGSAASRFPFGTNLGGGLVYTDIGTDGNLYFLQRSNGSLNKVIYTNNAAPVKLEAENAQLNGVVTSSLHPGFTGSGFADYIHPISDYIEWSVPVATAGSHEISFRYALAQGTRNLQVQVNGITVNANLAFPATGSWSSWSNVNISASLNAGTNKIRAIATGTSGPNMDYLVVTPQTLEAEQALLFGAKVASNTFGYSGSGFADFINPTGDYIEWLVNKHSAGAVSLAFRYANGSAANRPLQLMVNGVVVSSNVAFPPTGSWNSWSNATVNAQLSSGSNRIRLTAIGSSGANIDYLRWSNSASPAALLVSGNRSSAVMQNLEVDGVLSVMASPNPASGAVRLQINRSPGQPVKVSIVNASGRVYKNVSVKGEEPGSLYLPVFDLPQGIYIVIVEQGSKKASTKLAID